MAAVHSEEEIPERERERFWLLVLISLGAISGPSAARATLSRFRASLSGGTESERVLVYHHEPASLALELGGRDVRSPCEPPDWLALRTLPLDDLRALAGEWTGTAARGGVSVHASVRPADPSDPDDVMRGKRFVDPATGRPASILDILAGTGVIRGD